MRYCAGRECHTAVATVVTLGEQLQITVTPYEVKDGKANKKDVVIYSLPEMKANG